MTEGRKHDCDGLSADLPGELALLFLGAEEPSWTLLTLQLDRLGCALPRFRWCSTLSEGARLLVQEPFDAVIVDDAKDSAPTTGDDVLSMLAALRGVGCDEPVLILSDRVDDDWLQRVAEADVELLVTRTGWRSSALAGWISRAIRRHASARESALPPTGARRQPPLACDDPLELLRERRSLLDRLHDSSRTGIYEAATSTTAVEDLAETYSALLRTCVMAGADTLAGEIDRLTRQVMQHNFSASDALGLHLSALETLLNGLGARSARHVLQRTDLLLLEMLCRLPAASRESRRPRLDDSGLDLLAQPE
jgi:hypothetical protein